MAEKNTNTSTTCGNSSSTESNQPTAYVAPGPGPNPEASTSGSAQVVDRFKLLYPNVNENETPLPRCWSHVDTHRSMRLSSNNLRVQYKGTGKLLSDAASVRATHPIPPTCGIYYFEVKIISKGQSGYIGIGVTSPLSRKNILPGWTMQSYGFHGDDGNVYCSGSPGLEYGPKCNSGDIIGCCFNMVNDTVSFTINGQDLGIAFRTLPRNLFPTVGVHSRGAEFEANFGQKPFKFSDIESVMEQTRSEMKSSIHNFQLSWAQGNSTMQKLVSSFLVHHGYSETAKVFSQATGQNIQEDMTSIKIRQKISNLIMAGLVDEAVDTTLLCYPGLLETNKNLWFMLKCRQFIEYTIKVAELVPENSNKKNITETTTETTTTATKEATTTTDPTTTTTEATTTATTEAPTTEPTTNTEATTTRSTITATNNDQNFGPLTVINTKNDKENKSNSVENYLDSGDRPTTSKRICASEKVSKIGTAHNSSNSKSEDAKGPASPIIAKQPLEHLLALCKDLFNMGEQVEKENKLSAEERQLMQDACSSLAYKNPWASPLGWRLCPSRRQVVCRALNSAILESLNSDKMPPLESCLAHANELLEVMSMGGMGACAYANISEVFPKK